MAMTTCRPKKPCFFKPILSGSLDKISIPKSFMRDYLHGEECEGKAILRTKTRAWSVNLNKGCFADGWEVFAREHDLHIGYFLVFQHVGGMVFDVTVFDTTSCERRHRPLEVQKEKMKVAAGSKEAENPPQFTIIMQPYHFDWPSLTIPRQFARENDLTGIVTKCPNGRCPIMLKGPNGKSWEAVLKYKPSAKSVYIPGWCWTAFAKANKLKVGDACTFKVVGKETKKFIMEVSVSRSRVTG